MKTFKELQIDGAERTTWVFGAGASACNPYNVPVQSNMLREFLVRGYPGRAERQQMIRDLKAKVRSCCKQVIPGADPTADYVSLEEVFSAYEIALGDRRSSREEKGEAEEAISQLRAALRLAAYVLGRGDARKWKPHARFGTPSPYAELVEKLFPQSEDIGKVRHSFITFNYDICLDRCLINLRDTADVDLDYGIVLANYRISASPGFTMPRPDRSVLLLRTHGALNWLRCNSCYSVFTTVNKHAYVSEARACWACGSDSVDYVLVHPSFLRSYTDPVIQLVWGRCQEELVLSDRWVFVGYSLPMADIHFRELLRHSLRRREEARKDTEVFVVGRRTEKPRSRLMERTTWQNYKSLFSDRACFWRSTEKGFADFPGCLR